MTKEQALIDLWIHAAPEWVRHAYLNCASVNRVMKECAMRFTSREEMQWRVAAELYEQRNMWRDKASNLTTETLWTTN